jgi:plastocyanin
VKTRAMLMSLAVALGALAACAGDEPAGPTPDQPPASPSPAAGGGEAVEIFDFGYRPATLEVSAGTVVTWTNTGATTHTVTLDDGLDSGDIAAGATYEQPFDETGQFTYVCTIHPAMQGVINVSP